MLVISMDKYSFPSGALPCTSKLLAHLSPSAAAGHASRCSLLACLGFSCNAALGEVRQRGAPIPSEQLSAPAVWQGALLALLFGLWALATAASRVAMGRHYVGDVLTGWLIGFAEFRAVQLVTGATFCS
jgi:membrane-associated phospholipid phosphatase